MQLSGRLFSTEREPPADAAGAVEGRLRQAGFLEPVAAGSYVLAAPLVRVLARLEALVRGELARAGYEQVHAPLLQPGSHPGRPLGPEGAPLARSPWSLTDRRGDRLHVGTDGAPGVLRLVRRHVRSYRDLPARLLDLRTGVGDAADRSGLGARESRRVDAYAFCPDRAGAGVAHEHSLAALGRILDRAGVSYVTARAGASPGLAAHTLAAPSDAGPDRIVTSPGGAATTPHASRALLEAPPPGGERPMRLVETPDAVSIDALEEFLPDVPRARMMKTMLYRAELPGGVPQTVAALCRGDRQVDEVKLRRHLGAVALEMADPATVRELTGAEVGYAGPVGLPDDVRVVADRSAAALEGFVCGANRTGAHLVDVRFGRDLDDPERADIDLTQDGDPAPDGGTLSFEPALRLADAREIPPESAPGAPAFVDAEDRERRAWCHRASADLMRVVAAVVERHGSDGRLGWPLTLAPHSAVVVQVRADDEQQSAVASDLYDRLRARGVDVLWDDRDERAGVKFADAELTGIPIRVTVGRDAADGRVELVLAAAEPEVVPVPEACERIAGRVDAAGLPPLP